MDRYTLGEINCREGCAAPDLVSTSDESLLSSDGNPLLILPDEDVQQWIDRLLAASSSEPAMPPFPGPFAPVDYLPQPWSLDDDLAFSPTLDDDLLAFSPTLDTRLFAGPVNPNALHSPSLDGQNGSSAAPASPASIGSYLPSDFAASLSPTSWPVPTAFSPHSLCARASGLRARDIGSANLKLDKSDYTP